ncbi:MAG: hypothetical protein HY924_06910 [Elusimicrobia bacterium]|nr:hypothetical protein [Elusimicrobiota bacterium]
MLSPVVCGKDAEALHLWIRVPDMQSAVRRVLELFSVENAQSLASGCHSVDVWPAEIPEIIREQFTFKGWFNDKLLLTTRLEVANLGETAFSTSTPVLNQFAKAWQEKVRERLQRLTSERESNASVLEKTPRIRALVDDDLRWLRNWFTRVDETNNKRLLIVTLFKLKEN